MDGGTIAPTPTPEPTRSFVTLSPSPTTAFPTSQAWSEPVKHVRVEFMMDYGFFQDTNIREPTVPEIYELSLQTTEFYRKEVLAQYPNLLAVTPNILGSQRLPGVSESGLPVRVEFAMTFTFPEDNFADPKPIIPTKEELFTFMDNDVDYNGTCGLS